MVLCIVFLLLQLFHIFLKPLAHKDFHLCTPTFILLLLCVCACVSQCVRVCARARVCMCAILTFSHFSYALRRVARGPGGCAPDTSRREVSGPQIRLNCPLPAGVSAKAVYAGYRHTCAIVADGGVKCWGLNDHGQLGFDTAAKDLNRPADVEGGQGVA
jgi:hypothetical protein